MSRVGSMLLQGRVKGDRIGWLRVSQSQSVITGCNQVDLVEGFGLRLDCWINESMRLESGRVGIGAIGSGRSTESASKTRWV